VRRREFIAGLGSAAAWPVVAARAQQSGLPVIGYLGGNSLQVEPEEPDQFRKGLSETGYIEGQNVAIEYRWAQGRTDILAPLTADLIRLRVSVIAGLASTAAVRAAMAETSTIPILFAIGGDPVRNGLVASLNRPGGNVTGFSNSSNDLLAKRLEVLREMVPSAEAIGLLVNPDNPNAEADTNGVREAVGVLGLRLIVVTARTDFELDSAFEALAAQRPGALLLAPDPLFQFRKDHVVALAARHRIPAGYSNSPFATAGGLFSYGPDRPDMFRRMGVYTGRILKGEKASSLPVQRSTKFNLAINLKTAGALGLTIPETLLATADEVIQ
jgi:putative tryptophan/tyrosine transport system substrate-binding protein